MRIFRQFKREIRCSDGRFILLFALGTLLLGILSALIGGGHSLYYHICLPRFAPSPFGFFIIWTAFYLAIGAAAGIVVSSGCCCRKAIFLSGIIWWGAGLVVNLLWFPLFFGAGCWLVALLLIPIMIFCSIWTVRAFIRTSLLAALVIGLYTLWLFFCFLLQFVVILCN